MHDVFILLGCAALIAQLGLGLRALPRAHGPNRHVISACGLVLLMVLLYQVFPAFIAAYAKNSEFVWAKAYGGAANTTLGLLALNVALFAFLCGYAVSFRGLRAAPNIETPSPPGAALFIFALFLVAIGLAMKLLAVQLGGGVDSTLQRMSAGISQNMRLSSTSASVNYLRSFSGVADAAGCWLLIHAFQARRGRVFAGAVFLLVIAVSFATFGKRLILLWPLLVLALVISFYVRPIRPKHLAFIIPALLGFGFFSLMYRIYMPAISANVAIDLRQVSWAEGSILRFYFDSLEFAYFELMVATLKARDQINAMFGGPLAMAYTTHIEPFLYIIPRALWSGKPEVLRDVSHAVTALVNGQSLAVVRGGIAPSLVGTGYVLGGVFGLIGCFLALGIFAKWLDARFFNLPRAQLRWQHIAGYAFGLMVVFHLFRQGTLGWTFIICVVQQLGVLSGFFALFVFERIGHAKARALRLSHV